MHANFVLQKCDLVQIWIDLGVVHYLRQHSIAYLIVQTSPIGSMYGIYANIWGILMVNVTIYIPYMDPI